MRAGVQGLRGVLGGGDGVRIPRLGGVLFHPGAVVRWFLLHVGRRLRLGLPGVDEALEVRREISKCQGVGGVLWTHLERRLQGGLLPPSHHGPLGAPLAGESPGELPLHAERLVGVVPAVEPRAGQLVVSLHPAVIFRQAQLKGGGEHRDLEAVDPIGRVRQFPIY